MIYYNNSHVYLCVIVEDPVSYGQPVEHLVRVFIYFTENPLKITQISQKNGWPRSTRPTPKSAHASGVHGGKLVFLPT